MSTNITMSVLGLYKLDSHIFDDMILPTGVNKDTLTSNILMESAEFEALYPSADFIKWAIGKWSAKELPKWTKLNDMFNVSLLPDNDYNFTRTVRGTRQKTNDNDQTVTYNNTDTRSGSDTIKNTGTQSDSGSGTITNTGTQSDSGSNTTQVSAYNSSGWENREKTTSENTRTDNLSKASSSSNTRTDNLTEQTTYGSQNKKTGSDTTAFEGQEDVTYTESVTESGHKTSLSVVLEKNIELAYHDIYEVICDDFLQRFCLLIY